MSHSPPRCALPRAAVPEALAASPWLTYSGLRQHLFGVAQLYERQRLAGKGLHAAYLKSFCSAAGGDLLISIMEQTLPKVCSAHAAQLTHSAAPASSRARAHARVYAGSKPGRACRPPRCTLPRMVEGPSLYRVRNSSVRPGARGRRGRARPADGAAAAGAAGRPRDAPDAALPADVEGRCASHHLHSM